MKKKKKSVFVQHLILMMFCTCLYLGYKINEKKQLIQLPLISSWLPFEKWFIFDDSLVSNEIEYFHLVDDIYTSGTNTCVSLFDGIVIEVNETSIHILSDTGIQIVYGDLTNIILKSDERVLKGGLIGLYEDSLTMKFSKENQSISYEDAMKS